AVDRDARCSLELNAIRTRQKQRRRQACRRGGQRSQSHPESLPAQGGPLDCPGEELLRGKPAQALLPIALKLIERLAALGAALNVSAGFFLRSLGQVVDPEPFQLERAGMAAHG